MLLQQEQILSTLNEVLNQIPKIRKGTDAVYYCPICKHYKRKFEVSLVTGKYNCWVCGFSGTSYKTLLKKLNAPSKCYVSIGELKKVQQTKDFLISFDEEVEKVELHYLPKEYKPMYQPSTELEYRHALVYLKNRGITKSDILRYNIGYCTEGQYKNRIVVPSYDCNGNLNFFTARSFYETKSLKYVSCNYSKNIIGFEMLINFDEPVTLVEGPFDAIGVRTNCIPLFGKTMSKKLKMKLLEYDVPMVNVLLDNDALEDSIKICEFLTKHDIPVKLVQLDGKDPNVIGFEKTWQMIDATDTVDFERLFKLKITI